MTYHGSPYDVIANTIERAKDKADNRIARIKRNGFRRVLKGRIQSNTLTYEQKMAIPAYAKAVEVNKRHGISPPHGKMNKGVCRDHKSEANPATKYKNRYKKKRFVSLPKITMPMGDEE